jgi:hypothetical protein
VCALPSVEPVLAAFWRPNGLEWLWNGHPGAGPASAHSFFCSSVIWGVRLGRKLKHSARETDLRVGTTARMQGKMLFAWHHCARVTQPPLLYALSARRCTGRNKKSTPAQARGTSLFQMHSRPTSPCVIFMCVTFLQCISPESSYNAAAIVFPGAKRGKKCALRSWQAHAFSTCLPRAQLHRTHKRAFRFCFAHQGVQRLISFSWWYNFFLRLN